MYARASLCSDPRQKGGFAACDRYAEDRWSPRSPPARGTSSVNKEMLSVWCPGDRLDPGAIGERHDGAGRAAGGRQQLNGGPLARITRCRQLVAVGRKRERCWDRRMVAYLPGALRRGVMTARRSCRG